MKLKVNTLILLFLFMTPVLKADYTNFNSLYPEVENLITNIDKYQAPINNNEYWNTDNDSDVFADGSNETQFYGSYDFIIIGGGTAGGVLANRLTEENVTVLMIEAGSKSPDTSAILGLNAYLRYTQYNWAFNTTAQDNACFGGINNQCEFPRGKVLGGSSSINAGMYVRGNAADFNKWENFGWSYDKILRYFKKSEYANFSQNIDKKFHGFDGVQSISVAEDTPIYTQMGLDGFSELGFTELDYNGQDQIGYSRFQFYKSFNVRSGTNYSFINSVSDRPNLNILCDSLATKIKMTEKSAEGVEFIKKGQKYYATSRKEVLLSAGAVSSPQILMLSGIGPEKHLKELEIDVIADLPVGQYFQDHIIFSLPFTIQQPFKTYSIEEATNLWLNDKRPWNIGYNGQVINFFSFANTSVPDIELVMAGPWDTVGNTSTGNILILLLHPFSVGEITLASKTPRDFPLINPNYLANETDVESLYKGIQKTLELLNTTAFQKYKAEVSVPIIDECDRQYQKVSKDWWICQIRYSASSLYHPVASTRMGNNNKTSVVDFELKVHGIKKLRVVDAGVIPTSITGHTNAATVMIAEKIADVIKNDMLKKALF